MAEPPAGTDTVSDRLWAIRASISRLEEAKDKIVASLGSDFPALDAKEAYYGTVLAWELLSRGAGGTGGADNSRWALEMARSRARQCASALRDRPTLQDEFGGAFDTCYRDISAALDVLAPRRQEAPPQDVLVKKSDDEYQLLCSICGALAWTIRRGKGQDEKEWLKYVGICAGMELNAEDAPALFDLFAKSDIRGAHRFMYDKYSSGYDVMGIDAYCPECQRTYCRMHYNAQEEFDEGFYDCTYGVCPQGHKRLLDD